MNKGQKQNGQTAESFETVRTEWAPHISFTETTQYTALYEKGGQGEEKSHFTSNCLKTTGINGRQHIICLLCECVSVCVCVFLCVCTSMHTSEYTHTQTMTEDWPDSRSCHSIIGSLHNLLKWVTAEHDLKWLAQFGCTHWNTHLCKCQSQGEQHFR